MLIAVRISLDNNQILKHFVTGFLRIAAECMPCTDSIKLAVSIKFSNFAWKSCKCCLMSSRERIGLSVLTMRVRIPLIAEKENGLSGRIIATVELPGEVFMKLVIVSIPFHFTSPRGRVESISKVWMVPLSLSLVQSNSNSKAARRPKTFAAKPFLDLKQLILDFCFSFSKRSWHILGQEHQLIGGKVVSIEKRNSARTIIWGVLTTKLEVPSALIELLQADLD